MILGTQLVILLASGRNTCTENSLKYTSPPVKSAGRRNLCDLRSLSLHSISEVLATFMGGLSSLSFSKIDKGYFGSLSLLANELTATIYIIVYLPLRIQDKSTRIPYSFLLALSKLVSHFSLSARKSNRTLLVRQKVPRLEKPVFTRIPLRINVFTRPTPNRIPQAWLHKHGF